MLFRIKALYRGMIHTLRVVTVAHIAHMDVPTVPGIVDAPTRGWEKNDYFKIKQ